MKKDRFGLVLAVILVLLLAVGVSAADKKDKPKPIKETKISQQETEKDGAEAAPSSSEETSSMAPVYRAKTGEEINWQVISGGGLIDGSSANFRLSGTVGQTAVGSGSSDNFGLSHGFWQEFGVAPCDCSPGDANADGECNVGDAVYMINYVFKSGPPPIPYAVCSGDANGDCDANVGDAVYIINYVFKSGPPPVTCEEWRDACGPELYK